MVTRAPLVMVILAEALRRRRWSEEEKLRRWNPPCPFHWLSDAGVSAPVSCSAGADSLLASLKYLSERRSSPSASEPDPCHDGIIEIMVRNLATW
jgi:hypothetical protein